MSKTLNVEAGRGFAAARGSAVICDMLGCQQRATGEVQIGDEYIPLCELHRKAEVDRLTPKWRPLPPVRSSELVRRHATAVKDGYEVPLIGIPPSAVLETCDLCGNQYGMAELTWSGKQMLCKKCAS